MVKLSRDTLNELAEMICGVEGNGMFGVKYERPFRFRSAAEIDEFFENCGTDHRYDGTVRKWWVARALRSLNDGKGSNPDLPADAIIKVVQNLMAPSDFCYRDREVAFADLNNALSRDGFEAILDESGQCQVRRTGPKGRWARSRIRPGETDADRIAPPDLKEHHAMGTSVSLQRVRAEHAASVHAAPQGNIAKYRARIRRVLTNRDDAIAAAIGLVSVAVVVCIVAGLLTPSPAELWEDLDRKATAQERQELQAAHARLQKAAQKRAEAEASAAQAIANAEREERIAENEGLDPAPGEACLPGGELVGAHPPTGTQEWCQEKTEDGSFRPHGPWARWDESGQIVAKGHYRHGKRVGRWSYFEASGKRTVDYRNGR